MTKRRDMLGRTQYGYLAGCIPRQEANEESLYIEPEVIAATGHGQFEFLIAAI